MPLREMPWIVYVHAACGVPVIVARHATLSRATVRAAAVGGRVIETSAARERGWIAPAPARRVSP